MKSKCASRSARMVGRGRASSGMPASSTPVAIAVMPSAGSSTPISCSRRYGKKPADRSPQSYRKAGAPGGPDGGGRVNGRILLENEVVSVQGDHRRRFDLQRDRRRESHRDVRARAGREPGTRGAVGDGQAVSGRPDETRLHARARANAQMLADRPTKGTP